MKYRYLPFSVLIFILSLEILLRVVSWGFAVSRNIPFSFSSEVRIVTLGESTSTDNFEGALSWPQQLGPMLQQQGVALDIINLAKPGTNSFFLVQKLQSQILSLRPQVVIAMMGVNDATSLKMNENFWQRNFILARIFKWYQFLNRDDYTDENKNLHNKKGVNSSDANFDAFSLAQLEPKITDFRNEIENASLDFTLEIAKKLAAEEPQDFKAIIHYTIERIFPRMSHLQYRKFIVLNQFLLNYEIFDENTIYYRLYTDYVEHDIQACTDFTQKMWVKYSYQFSERQLSMIAMCVSKATPKQLAVFKAVLPQQDLGFDFDSAADPTQTLTEQSYRKLYELSQAHNFKLVAMQYPFENIDKLKTIFTPAEAENIIFISNLENFTEKLKSRKYEDLFQDHFAKKFGHPSTAGHELIARQLADVLPSILKQK